MNWLKYMVIIIVFVALMGFISLASLKHQSNVASTQDVDLNLSTINVGEARDSLVGKMDKETLISNLLLKVADSHKNHKHETLISYVFLDDGGNVTNNENNIKSVQFEVKLLNEKGEVQSISTERIEVDSLLGGAS